MNETVAFVVKIFIVSTIFSVVIKYGGRLLPINPTLMIAIITILLPSIIVAIALTWRSSSQANS